LTYEISDDTISEREALNCLSRVVIVVDDGGGEGTEGGRGGEGEGGEEGVGGDGEGTEGVGSKEGNPDDVTVKGLGSVGSDG